MPDQPAVRTVDRLVAALLSLSLVGYPLIAPLPVILGVDSRFVSVPYRAVVVMLALGTLALALYSSRQQYRGLFWLPFSAFWLMYSTRIAVSTFGDSVLRLQPWEYVLYAFGFCLLPAFACLAASSEQSQRVVARYSLIIAAVACVSGVLVSIQALRSGIIAAGVLSGRFALETLNPISFGELGALTATLSLWSIFEATRFRRRLFLIGIFAMAIGIVALSGSRGPAIGLVVGLTVIMLGARSAGRLGAAPTVAGILIALGLFVGASVWLENRFGFGSVARFLSTGGETDESGDLRRQFIVGALRAYSASPLVGASLDEPVSGEYPHNLVVESFMATGTVGGILFLTILLVGITSAVRIFKRSIPGQLLAALFALQLLSAMLSGALYLTGGFWCILSAVVAGSSARASPLGPYES